MVCHQRLSCANMQGKRPSQTADEPASDIRSSLDVRSNTLRYRKRHVGLCADYQKHLACGGNMKTKAVCWGGQQCVNASCFRSPSLLNLASWSRKHHVGLCTDYQKRLACGEVKSCVMAGRIHPLIFQSREDRAFARHLTWLLDPARA